MVWDAWCEANRELNEQKLAKPEDLQKGIKASWNLPEALEKNAVMPYYYGVKGSAAGKFRCSFTCMVLVQRNKNGRPDLS